MKRHDPERRDKARATDIDLAANWLGIHLKGDGADSSGPCPVCGGDDRFAINTKKQVFNCRGCEVGGDVIKLVMHVEGCDFKAALDFLCDDKRPVVNRPPAKTPDDTSKRELALAIWEEARPIPGTLAEQYLRSRGIHELPPTGSAVLRFHPNCIFGIGTYHPCLITCCYDIYTSQPQAIQRTALTASGQKIDRKMLGSWSGGAVKLWRDSDVTTGLVIGEGLETTLSAALSVIHRGTRLQRFGVGRQCRKFPDPRQHRVFDHSR